MLKMVEEERDDLKVKLQKLEIQVSENEKQMSEIKKQSDKRTDDAVSALQTKFETSIAEDDGEDGEDGAGHSKADQRPDELELGH